MDDLETVFPLPFYALIPIFLVCWPSIVFSEPIYKTTSQDGITITLYSDACQLKEVSNLRYRAVWSEQGRPIEGCWSSNFGVVALFFAEDKTVAIVPAEAFNKVTGV